MPGPELQHDFRRQPHREDPAASPRLAIVPRRTRPHSPLAAWHLLSLDAPTVAALWTWFVARCCGLHLPPLATASMFIAVWMLYATDRLLDARPLGHGLAQTPLPRLEERHRFHHRHRRFFLAAIALAALLLAIMLPHLLPAALRIYALLAALLLGYFLLIHTRVAPEHRLPKELAVGIFFPAAVFIPTVARLPHLRLALLPCALCFAAVCTLNCLFVYAWEHPSGGDAHWTTRFAAAHLAALSWATLAVSALLPALIAPRPQFHPAPLLFSSAISAASLLALHRFRRSLSDLHLRAAADLALMSPVLFAFFLRV